MSASTLTFSITTRHPDFNIITLLEEVLWNHVNKYGVISTRLDEVSSKACARLMRHVSDGSITINKIANAIVAGKWDLA